ncbi:RluA family pseudouridine synthase [Paremcibacter congregatus]|uniref:Pseudouridine synthase n=1 Tax=Paremcibacter congregatus TaxID=2043170 RepID=A0A2G4YSB0_9PROT|nr:RluA family pseudouridine synthase [Paremcibacter congregatus]PHZ85231.1 RNA pseudouridine synthase [Paremcibacter congregatus]QDE27835.1 RluA family pseudouridine synthase [Paremcibacter congregatus]|tara:strand:+ start:695 stop:1780 length:1086 start_codon:yes stop_codon:yes gene_type:complete
MTIDNSIISDETAADTTATDVTVDSETEGLRLDKFLSQSVPDISRSRLKNLVTEGEVQLAPAASPSTPATINDPSYRVKRGDQFFFTLPDTTEPVPVGQDIPLDVVYEDDQLIVINKAAGMVVHPAPGNPDGTLVNALIYHCGDSLSGINGVKRPGIVHRIDKDTSGLMVAAKTDRAHAKLAKQFAKHSLERAYQAVVWGVPNPAAAEIHKKIGRDPRNRLKMSVVPYESKRGRDAITHYRVLRRLEPKRKTFERGDAIQKLAPSLSLVECRLETGRTHQVRVHMASIRHPLVGDPFYGKAGPIMSKNFSDEAQQALLDFKRQALHAYVIGFVHPTTGETLTFEAELPNDMKRLISALEKN